MKRTIKMLTAVPSNLAQQLVQTKRVCDYNTMPSLNSDVLQIIRKIMVERIGYNELPMACLSSVKHDLTDFGDIFAYIPVNTKKSIIFQLEMPEDMLLTISLSVLLDISTDANSVDMNDSDVRSIIEDKLSDAIVLGYDESITDPISFIPFLAKDRCKFYARLEDNLNADYLRNEGLQETDFRQLTSFVN